MNGPTDEVTATSNTAGHSKKIKWAKAAKDADNPHGQANESIELNSRPPSVVLSTTVDSPSSPTSNDRRGSVSLRWKEGAANEKRSGRTPKRTRRDSLTVPGVGSNAAPEVGGSRDNVATSGVPTSDPASRRSSMRSLDSRLSGLDLSKLPDALAQDEEASEDEDHHAPGAETYFRSVIPLLPRWMAVVCLALNTCIPGLGTILSGLVVCCGVGETRVQSKDDSRLSTFCVNAMVGFMQLFTVTLFLVGWFWSFVWGIYMIILAVDNHKKKKEKHEKELQAKALSAMNAHIRPWSLVKD